MFKHFFISYSRSDGEQFARKLHDDLQKLGFVTWLDVYDIPTGADWDVSIDDGISNARAVLVILTPGSVASLQVKSEWNDAINRYLPVVPLVVQQCQVPRILRVFNYLDFTKDFNSGFQQLVNVLEHLGTNHLQYLKQTLRALEAAQQESPDPRRFRSKISDLRALINNWEERFNAQAHRISIGMEETKQQLADSIHTTMSAEKALKVVGQRPLDVTDFFKDRTRERQTIRTLIHDPQTRLISIIGRGGMGKTAIASKVISEVEYDSRDQNYINSTINGIAYFSTKTLGINIERIFHDLARMLNTTTEKMLVETWANTTIPLHDKISKLLDEFRDGIFIVLFDNIEDLLNENGELIDEDVRLFLEMSLVTRNALHFVVTTRIPLSLRREISAFDKQVHLVDGLPAKDATELLRDLDPNGNYGLLDALEEKLTAIANMTRGVPRALEVVVGLLANDPFLSPDDILSEFFKRDDVVSVLIEENYKRLDRASRRVLEAIAIYDRPITQVAVDYLLAPFELGIDAPNILKKLINTHIVSADRETKTVTLHPIDQEYVYSQIPDGNKQEHLYTKKSLHSRAAEYYQQIKIKNKEWTSIDDIQFFLWEIEHRLLAEEFDLAAHILIELDLRMATRGHAKKAKSLHEAITGRIGDLRLKLQLTSNYSYVCRMLGHLEEAAVASRDAVDLAREVNEPSLQLKVLLNLCEVMRFLGYLDQAEKYGEEALVVAEQIRDSKLLADLFWSLGILSTYTMKYEQAIEYGQKTLQYSTELGDTERIAFSHNLLGISYIAHREYNKALDHTEAALKLYELINQRDALIYIYNMMGMIHLGRGTVDTAISYINKGVAISREDNNLRPYGLCLYNLARAHRNKGDLTRCIEYAEMSTKILNDIGATYAAAAQRLADAIRAASANDSYEEANALINAARETSRNPDLYDPVELIEAAIEISEREGISELAQEARKLLDFIQSRFPNNARNSH